MAKKGLTWCTKVVAAGITAFGILALFCVFYYNPPVHVACEDGATCYKREAGVYWSRGTEGFASGHIDAKGYNNSYREWESREENKVDLLMMGSSQTEGLYVDEDKCVSYLLSDRFAEDGRDYCVYNIGMSAHTIYQNACNLETALDVYQPTRYVAIETGVVSYDGRQYQAIMDGSYPEITLTDYPAIMDWAQKIPYVKLLYQQLKNYKNSETDTEVSAGTDTYYTEADMQGTSDLLDYMNELVTSRGCTLVLYYVPEVGFDPEGQMYFAAEESTRDSFAAMCQERGILFVDLADSLQQAYQEDHVVGAGFSNTTVGYGHLNEDGHEMLAQGIYEAIVGKEEEP